MQGANVPRDLVAEAIAVVGSTKDAVLGTDVPLFDRIGYSLNIDPMVCSLVHDGTLPGLQD